MTAAVQPAGKVLAITGDMTIETASTLLQQGVAAMSTSPAEFDLAAVGHVDSAGLAVLFGWQRAASSQGKSFQIINPPRNLSSLASVYDVTDLLSLT
jgi:ABC-type transporter Mla MlaB component